MRLFGVFFFLREISSARAVRHLSWCFSTTWPRLGEARRAARSRRRIARAPACDAGLVDRLEHDGSLQLCAAIPPSGAARQIVRP